MPIPFQHTVFHHYFVLPVLILIDGQAYPGSETMFRLAVLSAATALTLAANGPLEDCTPERLFVADQEGLCRFHQCNGDGTTQMVRCAPGTRVPTWYRFTLVDGFNPCSQFVSDTKCLRCEIPDDEILPGDADDCVGSPCEGGCTCQDLWNAYYCLCDIGASTPQPSPVVTPDIFCYFEPCQNGATCHSQWDIYWCECPPGYTGKNCEVSYCDPNPCENGGTCVIDALTYHCQCLPVWTGPCCTNSTGSASGRIRPPTTPSTTTLTPIEPQQYTMTFSNASQCDGKKIIYISIDDEPLNSSGIPPFRVILIYTPGLEDDDRCFLNAEYRTTTGMSFTYDLSSELPNDCLETTVSEEITSGATVRVVDLTGHSLTVMAGPCDYDGFLAIKDKDAGKDFMVGTTDIGNYVTILALEDCTVYFNISDRQGAERTYEMREFQTLRIELTDLTGAHIHSDGLINVWSGDLPIIDENNLQYENVEQNIGYHAWGEEGENIRHYYFVGYFLSDLTPRNHSRHLITMQSFRSTYFEVYNWTDSGWNLVENRTASQKSNVDLLNESNATQWLVITERYPVQIIHTLAEYVPATAEFDEYLLAAITQIPSNRLYDNFFNFQIQGEKLNSYKNHYVVINCPLEAIHGVSIKSMADGENQVTYSVEELSGKWRKSMTIDGTEYAWSQIILNAVGFWSIRSLNADISAIYYGATAGGNGGSTAYPIKFAKFADYIPRKECSYCEEPVELSDRPGEFQCAIIDGDCHCNECDNFDDICTNQAYPRPKTCSPEEDTTGHSASIVFMHNGDESNTGRTHEIYVVSAAASAQTIRVSTPNTAAGSRCYINETFHLRSAAAVLFPINRTNCTEMVGPSFRFRDQMVRVESLNKSDLAVYAVNREKHSTEGWLALPDSRADTDFYVMTYSSVYAASQFAILALANDTQITITHNGRAVPQISDTEFTLQGGEAAQFQAQGVFAQGNEVPDFNIEGDLTGTRIQANRPIHVWSGNRGAIGCEEDPCKYNGSKGHLVEQAIPVHAWGQEYHIVPVPQGVNGDLIKVLAQSNSTVVRVKGNNVTYTFNKEMGIGAGEHFTFTAYSNVAYRVTANKKIMVAQITQSELSEVTDKNDPLFETNNDPSMLFVPPVAQYTYRYQFITPLFYGDSSGPPKPDSASFILISAPVDIARGISVQFSEAATGQFRNEFQLVENQSSLVEFEKPHNPLLSRCSLDDGWFQVPDSYYCNKAIRLPVAETRSVITISHKDHTTPPFMCLYYRVDDRESIGFNVGMTLDVLEEEELMWE